jgi:O-antigen/teichoic acid export membrane protein
MTTPLPEPTPRAAVGRKRRAALNAAFSYVNLTISVASAFFLTPWTLHRISPREYGYWLSSGEILGYAALFDLGILGLVPWLIAEADGQGDGAKIRWLLAHAAAVAAVVMAGFMLASIVGAWLMRYAPGMTLEAWKALIFPLLLMAFLMGINYRLMAYQALLTGLQDVTYIGLTSCLRTSLSFVLIAVILWRGGQLYALAIGAALPNMLLSIVSFFRARRRFPQFCRGWPRPSVSGIKRLGKESVGPWVSTLGVGFIERSQAVVITGFGRPELAPVYVGTAKLTQVFAVVTSILIDSALVGVAQLHGEQKTARKRVVIFALLRIQLVACGMIGCFALALNPSFVALWIGPRFFGGLVFNGLLALLLIVASFTYSIMKVVSVQGQRLAVGKITIIQGVAHLLATILFGAFFGLAGMVFGAILACALLSLRNSARLLRVQMDLAPGEILREVAFPWMWRAAPLLVLSAVVGSRFHASHLWQLAPPGALLAVIYAYWMHPCWKGLPLPATLNRWLARFHLEA